MRQERVDPLLADTVQTQACDAEVGARPKTSDVSNFVHF